MVLLLWLLNCYWGLLRPVLGLYHECPFAAEHIPALIMVQESAVEQFRRELEARNAWRREDHGRE
jgi:hypothetical protein